MSQSQIACPKCKRPLARKNHRDRIAIREGVPVAITPQGVELTCQCGARRVVEIRPRRNEPEAA